jgi:hypothetical protein
MINADTIRKRLEILVGQKLRDYVSAKKAAEVQNSLRQRSRTLKKGKSSVELLREWRDPKAVKIGSPPGK